MTTEQIRAMMANTLKELNERKKALANIKGQEAAAAKQYEPPQKVPLPPPKVVTIETVADKTKTIANLQAQVKQENRFRTCNILNKKKCSFAMKVWGNNKQIVSLYIKVN